MRAGQEKWRLQNLPIETRLSAYRQVAADSSSFSASGGGSLRRHDQIARLPITVPSELGRRPERRDRTANPIREKRMSLDRSTGGPWCKIRQLDRLAGHGNEIVLPQPVRRSGDQRDERDPALRIRL